ncbi:hypothetical protein [Piscirickettsia salmonis]|nr:hypothetical protein [Piscirickettsia salmonis]
MNMNSLLSVALQMTEGVIHTRFVHINNFVVIDFLDFFQEGFPL